MIKSLSGHKQTLLYVDRHRHVQDLCDHRGQCAENEALNISDNHISDDHRRHKVTPCVVCHPHLSLPTHLGSFLVISQALAMLSSPPVTSMERSGLSCMQLMLQCMPALGWWSEMASTSQVWFRSLLAPWPILTSDEPLPGSKFGLNAYLVTNLFFFCQEAVVSLQIAGGFIRFHCENDQLITFVRRPMPATRILLRGKTSDLVLIRTSNLRLIPCQGHQKAFEQAEADRPLLVQAERNLRPSTRNCS